MRTKILLIVFPIALTIAMVSCDKNDDEEPTPTPPITAQPIPIDTVNTPDTTSHDTTKQDTTPVKTKTEMLAKKWIVDKAYVNGSTPDNSSKGLTLDVRSNGSYTLSTGYVGTWVFEANETKINWDKGTQFNQVFTLKEFTDTKIDATFKSAFTGQNARWIMIPF